MKMCFLFAPTDQCGKDPSCKQPASETCNFQTMFISHKLDDLHKKKNTVFCLNFF